jgi:hypothetical protein
MFFFISLGIFAFGCGGGQSSGPSASPGSEAQGPAAGAAQIPKDLMLLLPKECFGAAFIDVEALRRTKLLDPQRNFTDHELTASQKKFADYLLEHSASAVACLARLGNNSREQPDVAAILRGNYNLLELRATVTEVFAADAAGGRRRRVDTTVQQYRGFQQLFASDKAQALVLDKTTLVVANRSLIPKVLAAAAGDVSARFVGSETHRKLSNFGGFSQCAFCGAMVLPSNVKNRVARRSSSNSMLRKYVEIVNGITTAGLRIDTKNEVDASLALETSSADHPAVLSEALKGMIMIGKLVYQDPTFSAVADRLTVSVDGLLVRIHGHAPLEQVTHIIALFKNALERPPDDK